MGFGRPPVSTLEDVTTPAPISQGIVTLDEIRRCLALIAKAVIDLRDSGTAPRTRSQPVAPSTTTRDVERSTARCGRGEALGRVRAALMEEPRTVAAIAREAGVSSTAAGHVLRLLEFRGQARSAPLESSKRFGPSHVTGWSRTEAKA